GLYKAEVIWRRGPWRSLEAVEYATLEWVDFRNGAVVVKRLFPTPMQHDTDRPLAGRSRWRCGDVKHRSRASAGLMCQFQTFPADAPEVCCFRVVCPCRDDASVRSRRDGRHIMPGP